MLIGSNPWPFWMEARVRGNGKSNVCKPREIHLGNPLRAQPIEIEDDPASPVQSVMKKIAPAGAIFLLLHEYY